MASVPRDTVVYPPDPRKVSGPIPRLDTLWKVEKILIDAWRADEAPLSYEEIKRRMGAKGVRHATVKTCVQELARRGDVAVAPSGVLWNRWSAAAVTADNARRWVKL